MYPAGYSYVRKPMRRKVGGVSGEIQERSFDRRRVTGKKAAQEGGQAPLRSGASPRAA